jgi:hypothetical protein
MKKFLVILGLILAYCVGFAYSQTSTPTPNIIYPTKCLWLDQANPDAVNSGSSGSVITQPSSQAHGLMYFSFTNGCAPQGLVVTSANLCISVTAQTGMTSLEIHRVLPSNIDWVTSNSTWRTKTSILLFWPIGWSGAAGASMSGFDYAEPLMGQMTNFQIGQHIISLNPSEVESMYQNNAGIILIDNDQWGAHVMNYDQTTGTSCGVIGSSTAYLSVQYAVPTATATKIPTATKTMTSTITLTSTTTRTQTITYTATRTYTKAPTHTPPFTLTATNTFTGTITSTATSTATATRTATATQTATQTSTATATATQTATQTSTATATATQTATQTATITATTTTTATQTVTPH